MAIAETGSKTRVAYNTEADDIKRQMKYHGVFKGERVDGTGAKEIFIAALDEELKNARLEIKKILSPGVLEEGTEAEFTVRSITKQQGDNDVVVNEFLVDAMKYAEYRKEAHVTTTRDLYAANPDGYKGIKIHFSILGETEIELLSRPFIAVRLD